VLSTLIVHGLQIMLMLLTHPLTIHTASKAQGPVVDVLVVLS